MEHLAACFGIFGGGAGYRGQNRTQREKSLPNMGVTKKSEQISFLTSRIRCADMPAARQKIHFFIFLIKNYNCLTQNDQKDPTFHYIGGNGLEWNHGMEWSGMDFSGV